MYDFETYFAEYICQNNHSYSDGSVYLNISCQDDGGTPAWEPLADNCSGIYNFSVTFSRYNVLSSFIFENRCFSRHFKSSNLEKMPDSEVKYKITKISWKFQ